MASKPITPLIILKCVFQKYVNDEMLRDLKGVKL